MNIIKIVTVLITLSFSTIVSADSLPVRQIRLSIYHLSVTNEGQVLMSPDYSDKSFDDLFGITTFGEVNRKKLYDTQVLPTVKITYNSLIMSASYAYISWALGQALFDQFVLNLASDHGIIEVPEFYELSVWKMALATKVWQQLGGNPTLDYCNHKQFSDIPLATASCPSEFSHLWNTDRNDFLKSVIHRNKLKGITKRSLSDAAKSATGRRKVVYEKLLKGYLNFQNREHP